jgi:2-(1,2-epoxy-1,2-dihydrophenyl)acetyl-CoA isomerase
MAYETIQFHIADGVAKLTLNRPDRLNAFNVDMHTETQDALGRVRSDGTVRVFVLTGAGRGFCAGQDLGDRAVSPAGGATDLGESIEQRY